jgi:hypothetical protein
MRLVTAFRQRRKTGGGLAFGFKPVNAAGWLLRSRPAATILNGTGID